MSTTRRLVLLTGDGPEHRYVAQRLHAAALLAALVVDRRRVSGGASGGNWRRALRRGVGHFLSKALRAAYLRLIDDARQRQRSLHRVLGEASQAFPPAKLIEIDGVRSEQCHQAIEELHPDLLLIYGTSIVPDRVLTLPRDLALNMHTGLSPHYRGTACAFWPVVNGEPHMLGATVHQCTADIDGGRIFATVRARFEADDDLHALFARAVIAGADAYVQVVQEYLHGALKGKPQDLSVGREYRGDMLTLAPELRARRMLRRGLLRKAIEHVC